MKVTCYPLKFKEPWGEWGEPHNEKRSWTYEHPVIRPMKNSVQEDLCVNPEIQIRCTKKKASWAWSK